MKILILDTETLGVVDQRVYDLGYVVFDTDTRKIVCSRDYIVSQVYDNSNLMQSAYYANKLPIYRERLASGYCKKTTWARALMVLKRDIRRLKVCELWAYNSRFDYRSIWATCKAYVCKNNPTAEGILDIMKVIGCITNTKEYRTFCADNGFLTRHKKPRCQKKAETLYRFLTQDTEYVEQHTALEDSKIELEILLKCQQTC